MARAMSPRELRALAESAAVIPPEVAFRAVGVGRTKGWELIRAGEWPTRTLRFGRLVKIPTRDLVELLLGTPEQNGAGPPEGSGHRTAENGETPPRHHPGGNLDVLHDT